MSLPLNPQTIEDKNKLFSDTILSVLLEANLGPNGIFRFCDNATDITWKGNLYLAFPFVMDEIVDDSSGEVKQFNITVSNIDRSVETYLQQVDGGVGSSVKIYVVNTKLLEINPNANADVTVPMTLTSVVTNAQDVTFTLGVPNPYNKRMPTDRLLKNGCRFRFKGPRCKYTGTATVCNKTLAQCRAYNNSINYGGFPGVGGDAIYI